MQAHQQPKREKIQQACVNCRAQKARCKPSDVPGTCEKCVRTKKVCEPHIPKQQTWRAKGKRRSLAKLESRIEALYQLVDQAGSDESQKQKLLANLSRDDSSASPAPSEARNSHTPGDPLSTSSLTPTPFHPPITPSGSNAPPQESHPATVPVSYAPATAAPPTFIRPPSSQPYVNHGAAVSPSEKTLGEQLCAALHYPPGAKHESLLRLNHMSASTGESLLTSFRVLTPNFPFVVLHEEMSIRQLVQSRPMLATTIFIVMTDHDTALQSAFEDLYRHALASKVIVGAQKSLDTLQSLLTFVAFHHHYFDTATQQCYNYTSLAATMAVDLDYHKIQMPERSPNRRQSSESAAGPPSAAEIEGMRALLGAYYLLVGLCTISLNKPRVLDWSPSLARCAELLAAYGKSPMDPHMPAMVDLLRITEEMYSSLRQHELGTEHPITTADDYRTRLTFSHFEQRLRAWDTAYPSKELTWLTPTRHFLSIYMYESALFLWKPSTGPVSLGGPSSQFTLLANCLSQAVFFLDGVLASPHLMFEHVALPVWAHLVTAIVILSRLSRPREVAGWDYKQAREAAKVEEYVDATVERMRAQAPHTVTAAAAVAMGLCATAGGQQQSVSGKPEELRPSFIRGWWMMTGAGIQRWVLTPTNKGNAPEEDGSAYDMAKHFWDERMPKGEDSRGAAGQQRGQQQQQGQHGERQGVNGQTGSNPGLGQQQGQQQQQNGESLFWDSFMWDWLNAAPPAAMGAAFGGAMPPA